MAGRKTFPGPARAPLGSSQSSALAGTSALSFVPTAALTGAGALSGIAALSHTPTGTLSGGSDLIAPASGLTYQNRVFVSMDFANDAAGLAGGIESYDILGSGERAWVADPAGGGNNVFRTRYVVNEDKSTATIPFSAASYVYFEWKEYWHASYSSASIGKANRLMNPTGETVFNDHILAQAPGNELYAIILQGSDSGTNIERNSRTPDLTKGEWNTMAVEQFLHTSTGYVKIWQKIGAGSWNLMSLDFRQYPHGGGDPYLTNQSYFSGTTAQSTSRKYGRAVVGGWVSGVTPGGSDYRYIKDVLVLHNASSAPT
jgi:hypothetical protein